MPDNTFSIDDVPKLDTDALDAWEEPGDLCPVSIVIAVDEVEVELRCEIDGPHDEHEAVLKWTDWTDDKPT